MYFIICYDISSNKRRTKLHEMLLGYGTPVQKSVFECELKRVQFDKLRKRLSSFVKASGESIRYYQMCRRCKEKILAYGVPLEEDDDSKDIMV